LTERFVIGIVGSPFGLNGFVKVKPFSGDIENLLRLREATLRQDGKERIIAIEESTAAPPAALLRFAGFSSPEAAKTLSGAEILVERSHASPLAAGEFYIEDLKGLAVISAEDHSLVGHISDIVEGGGGELVEITLPNSERKLVPFRNEFIAEINLEDQRLLLKNRWILE